MLESLEVDRVKLAGSGLELDALLLLECRAGFFLATGAEDEVGGTLRMVPPGLLLLLRGGVECGGDEEECGSSIVYTDTGTTGGAFRCCI